MHREQGSPATAPNRGVFTIDVEDWYQGVELPVDAWQGREHRLHLGLDAVLGLLQERSVRGTFFVLGWIAEQHPDVVKRISAAGHEIASHGFAHEKVYELTPERFRDDVRRTKGLLESLTGKAVVAHRSPYFSITHDSLWALEVLKQEGFLYDCSISPIETWRYGVKGSPSSPYRIREYDLVEFPVSTGTFLTRTVAIGGAYFRILPYFATRGIIKRLTAANRPFMFYAHPWEFDPHHPVIPGIDRRARLTHYFNLGATFNRTAMLLDEFPFGALGDVIETLRSSRGIPDLSVATLAK